MKFEDYKKLPKWKGKIFTTDEETCYNDGFAACKQLYDDKVAKLAKDFEEYKGLMRALEDKCEEMEGMLNTAACNAANTENNYLNLQQRNAELKEIIKLFFKHVSRVELVTYMGEHNVIKAEHAIQEN